MDMRDAVIAQVKTMRSYQRAIEGGLRDEEALRACCEGWMTGKLTFLFDQIDAAKRMLREGNTSGALMFLDMCDDPRKETK